MSQYSQNDEERVIVGLIEAMGLELGPGGANDSALPRVVLDVGAFDGVTFSNSRALLERRNVFGEPSWSGLLVEPCPGPAGRAARLYVDRPDVHVLIGALVARWGRGLSFEELRVAFPNAADSEHGADCDAVSTLDEKHRELWSRTIAHWGRVLVPAVSWQVLHTMCRRRLGRGPSVVSLDVEGTNGAALGAMVKEWFTHEDLALGREKPGESVRVLCVEKDVAGDSERYKGLLAPHGFRAEYESAENVVFRRDGAG